MLDLETWASGSILTGGNILLLFFLFSRSKASDANIGIIANCVFVKTTIERAARSFWTWTIENERGFLPSETKTNLHTLDACGTKMTISAVDGDDKHQDEMTVHQFRFNPP